MAIDGIIILDATGRPVIQSNFRTSPAAYPLLHVDAYNNALALSSNSSPDPVIFVPGHSGPSACCNISHHGLTFLCPVRGDDDPLFAFAFLDAFIETLKDYLGDVSIQSIKDSFDVVYQLLEEMLDDGHPLTTEPNALRDIILPPSFFNKIMSISGISGLSKLSANPFASPIPWRKSGVKYNHNEVYFDLAEEMDAVVATNGSVVDSRVWGTIKANCKLSGTPDLTLSFHNSQHITDPSFHPCVRIPKWKRDKCLSFVPPDGRFTLMSYQLQPQSSASMSNKTSLIALPFVVKAVILKTVNAASLEITISSRLREPVENLVMDMNLGRHASSVNCTNSAGSTWGFDPKSYNLRWEAASLMPSDTHTLKCTFSSNTDPLRPARALHTTFSITRRPFSALKIDQLKVSAEQYKPYKGVRGSSSGIIEWRL